MPTYDYRCRKCGRMFELFQSIKAEAEEFIETDCEKCENRAPVERCIGTGGGLIFKGSGFYQTDYRSESYKQAAKAETSGEWLLRLVLFCRLGQWWVEHGQREQIERR
jgi:putative FmdB family regulatory protein